MQYNVRKLLTFNYVFLCIEQEDCNINKASCGTNHVNDKIHAHKQSMYPTLKTLNVTFNLKTMTHSQLITHHS